MKRQRNVIPHKHAITSSDRVALNGHQGHVVLFTGLSGSGKSTIASEVELLLHKAAVRTYILDGDNLRSGLNSDLDFSREGRKENLRRVAHLSSLFQKFFHRI